MWVERFLQDCRFRGHRDNTLSAYEARLGRFAEYLGGTDGTPMTEVTRAQAMGFLNELADEGLSASSLRAYIATLRSLGQFIEAELFDEGWRNVYQTLRYPKLPQRDPVVLDEDDVEKMLRMLRRTPTQKRNYALVSLTYSSGLRASEVADLRIEDVDLEERTVFVRDGKGGKSRYSFISEQAAEAVADWLTVREKFSQAADSDMLWVGQGSDGINRSAVLRIVRKAGKRIGVKATPHTLRRSRGTHLRAEGVPIDLVQAVLGHSSPTTTQAHYVNVDPTRVRELVEEAL